MDKISIEKLESKVRCALLIYRSQIAVTQKPTFSNYIAQFCTKLNDERIHE